jgi:dCMP deaminase
MDRYDARQPKNKGSRPSKEEYFLKIAQVVAERSTCITIQFGAVIVHGDKIIGTGYNGAPRGSINCCDEEICLKLERNGERIPGHYTNCPAVHAEENAIINTTDFKLLEGSTIFINSTREPKPEIIREYGGMQFPEFFPCGRCIRLMINARLGWIVIPNGHKKDTQGVLLPYDKWNIKAYVRSGVFGRL